MPLKSLLGIGHLPLGAGIAAALGLVLSLILRLWLRRWWLIWLVVLALVLPLTMRAEASIGDDHTIVLDEFAAAGLLALAQVPLIWTGIGLALFFLLDALKPLGIGALEHAPGGVLIDDLAASLIAIGAIILLSWAHTRARRCRTLRKMR